MTLLFLRVAAAVAHMPLHSQYLVLDVFSSAYKKPTPILYNACLKLPLQLLICHAHKCSLLIEASCRV